MTMVIGARILCTTCSKPIVFFIIFIFLNMVPNSSYEKLCYSLTHRVRKFHMEVTGDPIEMFRLMKGRDEISAEEFSAEWTVIRPGAVP